MRTHQVPGTVLDDTGEQTDLVSKLMSSERHMLIRIYTKISKMVTVLNALKMCKNTIAESVKDMFCFLVSLLFQRTID